MAGQSRWDKLEYFKTCVRKIIFRDFSVLCISNRAKSWRFGFPAQVWKGRIPHMFAQGAAGQSRAHEVIGYGLPSEKRQKAPPVGFV
jgi:hypothetical protein